MSTTSEGMTGGVVNPPPGKGGAAAQPAPLSADPVGGSPFTTIAEEKTRSGSTVRLRELDYMGGKLVLYECVNQRQVGGMPVFDVTSSSMLFVRGDSGKKTSRRK